MKPVLDWVKSNWLIVVMAAMVVILPVGGIVGSGVWHEGIIASVEEEYQQEQRRLSGAQRVSYVVPAITQGGRPIELNREPNASITTTLAEELNRRLEEVDRVIDRAVEFNRAGHEPLVEGLFGPGGVLAPPTPDQSGQNPSQQADAEQQTRVNPAPLLAELRDVITGASGPESAYDRLFDRVNAGTPPDAVELAERLRQRAELERSKIEGQPTPEQKGMITETLRSVRLSGYRSIADRISMYGSAGEVLSLSASEAESGRFSSIPLTSDQARPEPGEAFVWQWDYWIVEDLLDAIRAVNLGPTGLRVIQAVADDAGRIESPGSAVKHLISIRIEKLDLGQASQSAGGGRGGRGGRNTSSRPRFSGGQDESEDAAGWPRTHTGRSGGAAGGPYDIRRASLIAVVAADRVDDLMDAITAENLMTVTGLEVEAIDPWAELERGYYYGPERVVRVRLDLETAWLRDWMAPLMPAQVRTALGVPANAGR